MTESERRARLVEWVLERATGLDGGRLSGDTPLLERRHLTSLHLPELLLFLESLRGEPVDVLRLRAGDLRDIDTICSRYLAGRPAAQAGAATGGRVMADSVIGGSPAASR
jgi:hypothetical protein